MRLYIYVYLKSDFALKAQTYISCVILCADKINYIDSHSLSRCAYNIYIHITYIVCWRQRTRDTARALCWHIVWSPERCVNGYHFGRRRIAGRAHNYMACVGRQTCSCVSAWLRDRTPQLRDQSSVFVCANEITLSRAQRMCLVFDF